ncbi:hypothetical protein BV133_1529 [Blastochloris viridis]|nr:hypothetical protein BV133_1529 [Blastochloris viridis]
MYKEYIQILPTAEAGAAFPLVACTEDSAASPADPAEADDAPYAEPAIAAAAPAQAALHPAAAVQAPDLAVAPAATQAPADGRIALIAATLALAVSTGALAWTLTHEPQLREPRQTDQVAALAAEVAALKDRLAAVDAQTRATGARLAPFADRLDRSERTQADADARLAELEAGLDARVKTAAEAAVAAAMPALSDITAAIPARAAAEPAKPATGKADIARGWVLRQVAHGVALVESRRGVFEVAVGTPLPGLGRVEAIESRGGRPVVVTSRGMIVER